MRFTPSTVLVVGLALVLVGRAHAQRQPEQEPQRFPGFLDYTFLVEHASVQNDLKMDKDQVDKVKEAVRKVREKISEALSKMSDLSPAERRAKMEELTQTASAETLKALDVILKPEQVKRLKQIELQVAGELVAFSRPEVQKALNLKDDQIARLRMIKGNLFKELRTVFKNDNVKEIQKEMAALNKQTLEKIQEILTDDQKKTWKEMTGAPFDFRVTRGLLPPAPGGVFPRPR